MSVAFIATIVVLRDDRGGELYGNERTKEHGATASAHSMRWCLSFARKVGGGAVKNTGGYGPFENSEKKRKRDRPAQRWAFAAW